MIRFKAIAEPPLDAGSAVRLAQLIEGLAVDDHSVAELPKGGDQVLPEALRVEAFRGRADEPARKVASVQLCRLLRLLGGAEDLLAKQHDDGVLDRCHAGHHSDLGRPVHQHIPFVWSSLTMARVPLGGEARP